MEFLLVSLVLSVGLTMFMRWRARKAQERYEARVRDEMARRAAAGEETDVPASPFGMLPFGGILEQMLTQGAWTRSYAYDEATGEWVEVVPGEPERPSPEQPPTRPDRAAPNGAAGEAPSTTAPARPSSTARRRPKKAPSGMFGMFGGGLDDGSGDFEVRDPRELPTFEDVGGMTALKEETRDSIGLLLQHPDEAERYGIEWNGILLYGPPGVGKTFFASAIAGEYGMRFIHVSTGDLVGSIVGKSARNIEKAFDTALDNLPCLLFFDEFDSVAQRRDQNPDQEARRTVNQLLTSLERFRDERRLLVVAATNSIEHLDPAVIRPGRFDRHIRIDLPDADARREIFRTELAGRPTAADVDLEDLVRRSEGMTPAAIEKVVELAALDVFRQATQTGQRLELDEQHLLAAVDRHGGQDRPTVEHWTWDSLILPEETKSELMQLQAVIEDPESARRFGVEPPSGLLLAGPPGTGKTTVAKVLAAEAECSFYPVSGADVMSKWVGESERNIRQLFERARSNRPSIVFIDEIDAIAGRRGDIQIHDSQVNQLLAELDGVAGQRGMFVIGATNRPDQVDPALLRGGRLSRTIVLGLPDEAGRLLILRRFTERMPTVGVRLEELARATDGFSPADLKALAQEAALSAMARHRREGADDATPDAPGRVDQADFERAIERLRPEPSLASW
ncbi:MAG TPA: AAA family ATPase [Actinomycetota bacterium]|nr:AAA family ATPase [Actinomycetota bacterium]